MDLLHILTYAEADIESDTLKSMVAITAMQMALTDVLHHVGIKPQGGIIGHSLGEIVCAYADGCLKLEECMLAAYWRGRCIVQDETLTDGAMAAVALSWDDAVERCRETEVLPACDNGPESVTLSGPKQSVEAMVTELHEEEIFAKIVRGVNVPFHTPRLESAAECYKRKLTEVFKNKRIGKPSGRWLSTSQTAAFSSADNISDYFANNFLNPVRFRSAMEKLPEDAVIIESSSYESDVDMAEMSIGSLGSEDFASDLEDDLDLENNNLGSYRDIHEQWRARAVRPPLTTVVISKLMQRQICRHPRFR